ncbi:MAG: WD-40 repeat protein [Candidatus Uhrbacteria bacterium GW2011_GWF2_40_263]|nr:MAG: WD-40 repeat protein [Candidatus Uhrbacteria bacterium GW2011_GWF2_40_263]
MTQKQDFASPQYFVFKGHNNPVSIIASSPCEPIIVSGERDRVRVWNLFSKNCIQTLTEHHADIVDLRFSPHGKLLIIEDTSPQVCIWDWKSARLVKRMKITKRKIGAKTVLFSPDSSLLICLSEDAREMVIWDIKKDEAAHMIKTFRSDITCMTLSHDGRFLAVNSKLIERRRFILNRNAT